MSPAITTMIGDDMVEHPVRTVGGCTFNLAIVDVWQSNGVIHVIDTVLMP